MLGADHLQGNRPLEPELLRPVDHPHVAEPDDLVDPAARNDGAERKRVGGVGSEPVVPGPDLAPAPQGWAEAEARVSQAAAEPGSQVRAGRQPAARAGQDWAQARRAPASPVLPRWRAV